MAQFVLQADKAGVISFHKFRELSASAKSQMAEPGVTIGSQDAILALPPKRLRQLTTHLATKLQPELVASDDDRQMVEQLINLMGQMPEEEFEGMSDNVQTANDGEAKTMTLAEKIKAKEEEKRKKEAANADAKAKKDAERAERQKQIAEERAKTKAEKDAEKAKKKAEKEAERAAKKAEKEAAKQQETEEQKAAREAKLAELTAEFNKLKAEGELSLKALEQSVAEAKQALADGKAKLADELKAFKAQHKGVFVAPRATRAAGERGPVQRGRFKGATLHALKETNPRREGSFGHVSYQIILDNPGIGYEDYVKKGGRPNDLAWDIDHGNAEVKYPDAAE